MILRANSETIVQPEITQPEAGWVECNGWEMALNRGARGSVTIALAPPDGESVHLTASNLVSRASLRKRFIGEMGIFLDDADLDFLLGHRAGKAWQRGALPRMLDALRAAEDDA